MFESEVARFAGAAVSLAGLGVVAGISPTFVAETLRVLTGLARAYRAISFMLSDLTIGTTIILLLFRVVDPRTFEAVLPAARTETTPQTTRRPPLGDDAHRCPEHPSRLQRVRHDVPRGTSDVSSQRG